MTRAGYAVGGVEGCDQLQSGSRHNVLTADGYFDGLINWGHTLIKLVLTLNQATGTYSLVPADYFTPSDEACRFTNGLDLGSAGPLILPAQGGTTPDLIFRGGKAATLCDATPSIYIVNRDNMGHLNGQVSPSQTARAGTSSSPAYWASATANYIYSVADSDPLRAYTVSSSGVSTASVLQTGNTFLNGSSPAVSANGTSNGLAVQDCGKAAPEKRVSPHGHPAVYVLPTVASTVILLV